MIYTDKILKASKIMAMAHCNQVDKGGYPYIMHPIHLAEQLAFEDEIIVALLHDVMEDHPEYEEGIKKAGFSSKVIEALSILNRNSCENSKLTYYNYINRVGTNRLATIVKLLDLHHNMNTCRISPNKESGIRIKDLSERYAKSYEYLFDKLYEPIDINNFTIIDVAEGNTVSINTSNYSGKLTITFRKSKHNKDSYALHISGFAKCKHNNYPTRKCSTSLFISSKDKCSTLKKSLALTFRNVAYNRNLKVLMDVGLNAKQIDGIRLLDKPNTLSIDIE